MLRAIAGLLRPGARARRARRRRRGSTRTRGIDLPPERRSVGLVFQEYALFPHLDVRRNVAFGGRGRGRRAARALPDRPPRRTRGRQTSPAASGSGSRSRARSPATRRVLLLDEPLSALDAHTRGVVRGELAELLAELRLPTLLVTHDFEDAAALADRVGVIVDGRILPGRARRPSCSPRPADAFVASFTGANLLPGDARAGRRRPDRGRARRRRLDVVGGRRRDGPGRRSPSTRGRSRSRAASPDDSAVNHVRGDDARRSSTLGNRVRVARRAARRRGHDGVRRAARRCARASRSSRRSRRRPRGSCRSHRLTHGGPRAGARRRRRHRRGGARRGRPGRAELPAGTAHPARNAWWRAGLAEAIERDPSWPTPARPYEAAPSPRRTRGATRA